MLPGATSESGREHREALLRGVMIVSFLLVLDVLVLGVVRTRWAGGWEGLRRSLVGPGFGVRDGFVRYVCVFGALLVVDFVVLRRRSALGALCRFGRSERLDVFLFALRRLGLGMTMPVLLSVGGVSLFAGFVSSRRLHVVDALLPSPLLRVLVAVVLLDFFRYWLHRVQHRIDVLWRFHAVHHSATSFTLMTGVRVHPIDHMLDTMALTVVLGVVGVTSSSAAWVVVAKMTIDFAQHSMVPFTYGVVGKWLVYSPVGHRIHHSPLREHWDHNYGDLLPIWDRLFGTWYRGSAINERVGLDGVQHDGLVASIVRPFGEATQSLATLCRNSAHVSLAGQALSRPDDATVAMLDRSYGRVPTS